MSDAMTFTVSMDGVVLAATDVQIQYTSFGSGAAANYYVSFYSQQDAGLEPDDEISSLIVVEYAGDQQVGSISFTELVTHETVPLGHDLGEYGNIAVAIDVQATGSCEGMLPCFAAGTHIATPQGGKLVEELAPGDLLTLCNGDLGRVAWVGHRRSLDGDVVRVRALGLGTIPHQDLYLSPDHGVFVDDVIVPVGLLVNDINIFRETRSSVVFFHVELEEHGILVAEGLPAESYLDTGNRRQFSNCAIGYDPLAAEQLRPCASIVTRGEPLARVRELVDRGALCAVERPTLAA